MSTQQHKTKLGKALVDMVSLIAAGEDYFTAHCRVIWLYQLTEREAARIADDYDFLDVEKD